MKLLRDLVKAFYFPVVPIDRIGKDESAREKEIVMRVAGGGCFLNKEKCEIEERDRGVDALYSCLFDKY